MNISIWFDYQTFLLCFSNFFKFFNRNLDLKSRTYFSIRSTWVFDCFFSLVSLSCNEMETDFSEMWTWFQMLRKIFTALTFTFIINFILGIFLTHSGSKFLFFVPKQKIFLRNLFYGFNGIWIRPCPFFP